MVLAQGGNLNVPLNHHAVVVVPLVVPDCIPNDVARVLVVSLREVEPRFGKPLRRVQQAGAVWVLADTLKEAPDMAAHLLYRGRVVSFRGLAICS
jgi:hypothetical protein